MIYEQPLNEQMRLCLRLEQLFNQFLELVEEPSHACSDGALTALLRTLHVIERPDLKSKLSKVLSNHANSLTQLETHPHVDHATLRTLIDKLDYFMDMVHHNHTRLGDGFFQNEFINSIRQHFYSPSGPSYFNMPAYSSWLNRSVVDRQTDLKSWYKALKELHEMINLILQLTRQGGALEEETFESGFFQKNLDSNTPVDIIRINLPNHLTIYPEISVGRHGLSIRFMERDYLSKERAAQITSTQRFELACCGSLCPVETTKI